MGVVLCLGALVCLLWETAQDDPMRLWVLLVMLGLAFLVEAAYRGLKGRTLRLAQPRGGI